MVVLLLYSELAGIGGWLVIWSGLEGLELSSDIDMVSLKLGGIAIGLDTEVSFREVERGSARQRVTSLVVSEIDFVR